jgi:hypothetical protein
LILPQVKIGVSCVSQDFNKVDFLNQKDGVTRVISPVTEGSTSWLLKTPVGVASISCRNHQIQHSQETLTCFPIDFGKNTYPNPSNTAAKGSDKEFFLNILLLSSSSIWCKNCRVVQMQFKQTNDN